MTPKEPQSKQELLRLQCEGKARWETLIAAVPCERVTERGVKGERSIKDIVAHLAAWERHATARLEKLARGEAPEPLPPQGMTWREFEHAFNAKIHAAWLDRSWDEVRAEADSSHADFLVVAERVPEDILFAPERAAWQIVAFNGYLHYLEYVDHVQAWLRLKSRS